MMMSTTIKALHLPLRTTRRRPWRVRERVARGQRSRSQWALHGTAPV